MYTVMVGLTAWKHRTLSLGGGVKLVLFTLHALQVKFQCVPSLSPWNTTNIDGAGGVNQPSGF